MNSKSDPEKSPFDKSEIMALGHKIQAIQKQAVRHTLAIYEPQVNEILETMTRDKNTIERTLDALLDVAFDDDVLLLYKKLCRYYYRIDPRATADYISFYREMWDNEEDDIPED